MPGALQTLPRASVAAVAGGARNGNPWDLVVSVEARATLP